MRRSFITLDLQDCCDRVTLQGTPLRWGRLKEPSLPGAVQPAQPFSCAIQAFTLSIYSMGRTSMWPEG